MNHFIGELEQNGVVEVMKVQNCSKLRLLHYDTLCRMRVKTVRTEGAGARATRCSRCSGNSITT